MTATIEEKEQFFQTVIDTKKKHQVNVIEAVLMVLEERDMDIDTGGLLVNEKLKALLAQTAEDLHFMPRRGRLSL